MRTICASGAGEAAGAAPGRPRSPAGFRTVETVQGGDDLVCRIKGGLRGAFKMLP